MFRTKWNAMTEEVRKLKLCITIAEESNNREQMEIAVRDLKQAIVLLSDAVAEAITAAEQTMREMGD